MILGAILKGMRYQPNKRAISKSLVLGMTATKIRAFSEKEFMSPFLQYPAQHFTNIVADSG
ncbi:MAG: hypothetical protein ACD_35C00255G0001 [uncultured bacterium]|nr:MAG: hypothetical protein ACD_35C00255G0001 [uncultured bacterium]